jgi:DNA adenine methylase
MTQTAAANPMKITAIAPWFGGKRTMAPRIAAELGKHRAYWEPFCGSMAVLFAKPECKAEIVNDLHHNLIGLARVLADPDQAVDLYGRVARTIFHEDLLLEARERLEGPDGDPTQRAYWFVVWAWFSRNGTAGQPMSRVGRSFCVRYSTKGGDAATRWRSVTDSIPAWHERLRRVTILNRDAFEIIPRIEDEAGVTIYCDPPYLVKTSGYLHDFEDGFMTRANDHQRLAEALRRFKRTRIVVSYYDHPALRGLYPGWTCVPVQAAKFMANSNLPMGASKAVQAPEVLIINGPSFTEETPQCP